ncbi:MAG: T9SS type A sorting domain-containing protein [Saprospiraceae bacterium]|nr:T9SS type A sorting domain-containing protein [Saprospiraceae bacterium]
MKLIKIISLIIFNLISNHATTQWHDLNWILGDGHYFISNKPWPFPNQSIVQLNFRNSQLDTSMIHKINDSQMSFTTNCISDKNGELLFYTDGSRIFNRKHEILKNGDTINPGILWNRFVGHGYPMINGALFLPKPNSDHEYYLFHKRYLLGMKKNGREWSNYIDRLFYSKIDITPAYPDGICVAKNETVFESIIGDGELNAVLHANGRDYWIVTKESVNPIFHFTLLDPSGPRLHHSQKIGISYATVDAHGNCVFSSNGDYFARILPEDGIELFRFDRCEGRFYDPISLPFLDTSSVFGSVEFSQSGEYLYVNSYNKIWQYHVPTIRSSQPILVAEWDGLIYFGAWSTSFYTGRLAADGKIYYSVFGSNGFTLSVIHEPDKKGLDCNVEQHGIILSSLTEGTLPFFPNYRLGPLKGSSCDTIVTSSHEYIKQENYFVDANSILRSNACNPTEKLQLEIISSEGKIVSKELIYFQHSYQLKIDHLSSGIYYLKITNTSGDTQTLKMMR